MYGNIIIVLKKA